MVDRHNCLKNDVGVTVGHLPQTMFYKNNTDFNIANWAKCDIKIFEIKTCYTVAVINQYNKVLCYYPKIIQSIDTVTCCYSVSIQTQQMTCLWSYIWIFMVYSSSWYIGIPMSWQYQYCVLGISWYF